MFPLNVRKQGDAHEDQTTLVVTVRNPYLPQTKFPPPLQWVLGWDPTSSKTRTISPLFRHIPAV